MKLKLVDSYGRTIDYLRLAVTDRCNLRCTYCMPAYGIDFVQRSDLLSYEEMRRVLLILAKLGINKLRITGGEPFVRKGLMEFLEDVHQDGEFESIHLTTNATLTEPFISRFPIAGIKHVNISLDTLNRDRFIEITRRDQLSAVIQSIEGMYEMGIKIKINMVVMADVNSDEIITMSELARNKFIDVRYLEEMPFNGTDNGNQTFLSYRDIRKQLEDAYGILNPIDPSDGDTSQNFKVSGFAGTLGIIPSFSRTFCGTCNRLRITPKGLVKTCLYGNEVLDLRVPLRNGSSDEEIALALIQAVASKPKDGFEAEQLSNHAHASMATIGG